MSKSKLFSIITIACFVSILCIPIGIVLMIYYTSWKKKTKIILSISLTTFYAALFAFFFLIKPAYNTGGVGLPFGANSGYTAFVSGSGGSGNANGGMSSGGSSKKNNKEDTSSERLPKKVKQAQQGGKSVRSILYPVLFFLFMLFLIIMQNVRNKGKSNYENPYVDTNKYKLPLSPDSKMPMVHFLHLDLNEGEKILFATETTQKGNEGNLVITNTRAVILNLSESIEIPLDSIISVSETTTTVMTIGMKLEDAEKKYYVFMPENQMKYAIAILKWVAKNIPVTGVQK